MKNMAKDNLNNRRYTKEEEEKLIARMLSPESISPTNLSIETGKGMPHTSISTAQNARRNAR